MDQAHLAVRMAEVYARHAHRPATRILRGDDWETLTYGEFERRARSLARHLVDAGVQPGDRVALFSANRPEWSIVDFALLSIRAVVVPLYPTSTPEQARHILADSGSVFAIVETAALLARVEEVWDQLGDLRGLWTIDDVPSEDDRVAALADVLAAPASDGSEGEVSQRLADASGDDIASIVYTSGTTGDPRGAVLTTAASPTNSTPSTRSSRSTPRTARWRSCRFRTRWSGRGRSRCSCRAASTPTSRTPAPSPTSSSSRARPCSSRCRACTKRCS